MRLTALLLCKTINPHSGSITGLRSVFYSTQYPCFLNCSIFLRLEGLKESQPLTIQFRILTPTGTPHFASSRCRHTVAREFNGVLDYIYALSTGIPEPGDYVLVLDIDGEEFSRTQFSYEYPLGGS